MENINSSISKNLKQIRKEKGLTLEDLSTVSGVSKSMLGEIERGGTNPTILVLWKIADGLKIPLTALIKEDEPEYSIVRSGEMKVLDRDDDYNIYSIFPYYEPHRSEILKIEIYPSSVLENSGHMSGVDEYIYVEEGRVKLILDGNEIILNKGDSIRFRGELSHQFISYDDETVVLMNILNYRREK